MDYAPFYAQHLEKIKWGAKDEGKARCPFHEDKTPSLAVNRTSGLWYCHGCAEGGTARQFAERRGVEPPPSRKTEPEAIYVYTDEGGKPLSRAVRLPGKKFYQERYIGPGHWKKGVKGVRWVPYRLHKLAKASGLILIPEGERDVHNLERLGFTATTNPMGAGKWRAEYNAFFRGHPVVVLADNDEPGRKHAHDVARNLHAIAASVKVLEFPELPAHGDVSDAIARGLTKEQLLVRVEQAPEWSPSISAPARMEGQTLAEAWPGRIPEPFGALRLPAGYTGGMDGLRTVEGALVTTTPILPTRIVEDVHSEDRKYEVLLLERGAARTMRVDVLDLHDTRGIVALAGRGLDVNSLTAPGVIKFVTAYVRANRLEWIRETGRLGYAPSKGGPAYVLDSVYPPDADIKFAAEGEEARQRQEGLRPTGDLAGVAQIVSRVSAYPFAITALCAAVAPVVRILLRLPVQGFTLHLVAPTSRGKSIAQRLAVSAWADPFSPGWFHHGLATYLSVEETCLRTDGLPVAFDDFQLSNDADRLRVIYSVGNDSWKGRGGKWRQPDRAWRGVLITSGEYPLVDEESPGGAGARVITLPGPPFGEWNEEQIPFLDDWLQPELRRHHGILGRAVLQRLLSLTDVERSRLVEVWQGRRDVFAKQAAGDSIFARLAPQWALLGLTATLIQEVLGLPTPVSLEEAVCEAFTSAQELPTPDRIQQAYTYVRSWAESNRAFFYVRTMAGTEKPAPGRTVYGLINDMDHSVAIFANQLKAELARFGEQRPQALLRAWRNQRLLRGKGKDLTYPVSLPGRRVRMYVLETPEEPEAPDERA